MNPPFRERLREILYENQPSVCEDSGQAEWTVGEADKVVAEILSLVRECVPDKRHLDYGGGGDIVWASAESEKNGWNACRQAILNEIGEGDA